MDTRRTETCVTPTRVVPRHVDTSRHFLFFSERAAWGGGGGCQTFFSSFFPLISRPRAGFSPCKVVFFGLTTNALNVRNNNKDHIITD